MTQEREYYREEVAEEVQETESFYDHPDEGIFQEDERYATKETYGSPQLLLTREEVKCLLRAYDEGEPGKEEQVTEREECPVEEEHDSQHHKQRPKRGQCNANLLRVGEPHHGWIPVSLAGGLSDDGYA